MRRSIGIAFIAANLVLAAGCGGSLYKVKPPVTTPLPSDVNSAGVGELSFVAVPLASDEESQDLFEANLPMSGILPVRLEAVNYGSSSLDLSKASFRLRDATGHEWKIRTPKQTAQHVMDFEKVYIYNPSAKKEYVTAMQQHGFDLKTILAPGGRRTGILFFRSPGNEQIYHPGGLTLAIEKLAQPVEIALH